VIKFIQKVKTQIIRFRRARKLGLTFFRNKTFAVPSSISICNQRFTLSLPKESGVTELFRDIILDDEYWLHSLPASQINNILDVGANIGLFSVAAKICFPQACIHAYEPNLDVKKHLDHQASTFGFRAIYEAIGKTSGRGTLSKNLECDTAARVNQDEEGNVRITSLSQAIDRYDDKFVDLLKLDCEGYEHQLMEEKGPWSNCKYLAMEYHLGPEMKPESMCSTIQDLGFVILNTSSRNSVIGNILAQRVN
jgi:FkbM family methyltransferase